MNRPTFANERKDRQASPPQTYIYPQIAHDFTDMNVSKVAVTSLMAIPAPRRRREAQLGESCAAWMRGSLTCGTRMGRRRSSYAKRGHFSSPPLPVSQRHRRAPFFPTSRYVNALQSGEQSEGERVQCTGTGVPRTPLFLPGGCAFVAGISIHCNQVSRFSTELLPLLGRNFIDR